MYKNIKMTLTGVNILVVCTILLLTVCFVLAVNTAENANNASAEISSSAEQ